MLIPSLLKTANASELLIRQAADRADPIIDNKLAVAIWASRPTRAAVRSMFNGDTVPGVLIVANAAAGSVPLTPDHAISVAAESSRVRANIMFCIPDACLYDTEATVDVLLIADVIAAIKAKVTTTLKVRSVRYAGQASLPREDADVLPDSFNLSGPIPFHPIGTITPVGADMSQLRNAQTWMAYESVSIHPSATVQYIPFHDLGQ